MLSEFIDSYLEIIFVNGKDRQIYKQAAVNIPLVFVFYDLRSPIYLNNENIGTDSQAGQNYAVSFTFLLLSRKDLYLT